jgi:hypothetical protein
MIAHTCGAVKQFLAKAAPFFFQPSLENGSPYLDDFESDAAWLKNQVRAAPDPAEYDQFYDGWMLKYAEIHDGHFPVTRRGSSPGSPTASCARSWGSAAARRTQIPSPDSTNLQRVV